MSDLELAVGMSRKLERMLKDGLGAEGKGLGQQAMSVKDRLPAHTFDNLMRVAGIRNRVVHEGEPIHAPERFTATCASIAEDLKIVYSLTHAPRVDHSVQKRVAGVNAELLRMTPEEPAPVRAILNAPLDPDAEKARRAPRGPAKTLVVAEPTFRGLTLPSRIGEATEPESETKVRERPVPIPKRDALSNEAPASEPVTNPLPAETPKPAPKVKAAPARAPRPAPVPVFIPDSEPVLVQSWTIPPPAPPAPKPAARPKVKPAPEIVVARASTPSTELAVVKKRAPAKKAKAPSAAFVSVVVEYGVVEEALLGMVISLELTVQNMKNSPCQATAYFFSGRGEALLDFNDEYCTEDGHVCVWEDFVPQFNDTHLSEFTLFMPYDELHLEVGEHDLMFAVGLHSIESRVQFAMSKAKRFSIVY